MSCDGEKITYYFYLNLKISPTKCQNHGFIDSVAPYREKVVLNLLHQFLTAKDGERKRDEFSRSAICMVG
jgi:hypothetical protein